MPLSHGTRLGRYKIVSTLGSGGMGEVYCAEDALLAAFAKKSPFSKTLGT